MTSNQAEQKRLGGECFDDYDLWDEDDDVDKYPVRPHFTNELKTTLKIKGSCRSCKILEN